eukprot:5941994-Amphidinium_carterae.1
MLQTKGVTRLQPSTSFSEHSSSLKCFPVPKAAVCNKNVEIFVSEASSTFLGFGASIPQHTIAVEAIYEKLWSNLRDFLQRSYVRKRSIYALQNGGHCQHAHLHVYDTPAMYRARSCHKLQQGTQIPS